MQLSGPESIWSSARPLARLLPALVAALTLMVATAMTPVASAQEVPTPVASDVTPAPPEQPTDPASLPEQAPAGGEPTPPVELSPTPEPPPPPPDVQTPADTSTPPVDEDRQSVPGDGAGRDAGSQDAATASQPVPTSGPAGETPAESIGPAQTAPVTSAPLGWDVYDDSLVAELNGTGGVGGEFGAGGPPSFGGLRVLRVIGPAAAHDKRREPEQASRANATPAGSSLPGGSGPGQGPSLGLFGAAGGSGAGMALLTLLGMACGWFLIRPDRTRAFLTSTATWRLLGYVPPIERPG